MKAVRVHQNGGSEVLKYEDVPLPEPKEGEVRLKIEAVGLNYIDIYQREGLYPLSLPFILGMEGAGLIDAVGARVKEFKEGDHVAYAMVLGSYAEFAVVPSTKLVPLPRSVDSLSAAAVMLQGMTAHYLSHSTFPLKKGHTALVHAAAGGVGLLLTQMAKQRGAKVFGTVSTEEKAKLAREAGADEIIFYTQTNFANEVKKLTNGHGASVVYDSVGQTTFEQSLDCLIPRGVLVLYGQSSGPVPPFNLGTLAQKGSLFVTRPTIAHYMLNRKELLERAGDLFKWLSSGKLKLRIDQTFPLSNVSEAHRQLEGRKTTGKVLLIP